MFEYQIISCKKYVMYKNVMSHFPLILYVFFRGPHVTSVYVFGF